MAPHIDDEVIGCYTLLKEGLITDVVYYDAADPIRVAESVKSSQKFGFKPLYSTWQHSWDESDVLAGDNIFVPTIKDVHPDHKRVNMIGRRLAAHTGANLFFYSIDMNTRGRRTLMREDIAAKRAALNELFPSQSKLLSDDKYSLFEHISESETTFISTVWNKDSSKGIMITADTRMKFSDDWETRFDTLEDVILGMWRPESVEEIVFVKNGSREVFRG